VASSPQNELVFPIHVPVDFVGMHSRRPNERV
jgi:hypothetical protein